LKRSFLASTAAAALVLTGCSSGTKTVSEAQPTTSAVSPESVVFSWQQAYADKLGEFRNSSAFVSGSSGSMFDLYDLTGDGVPELVISPSIETDAACDIYTAAGSSLVKIGSTGSKGVFGYIPAQNTVGFHYHGKNFELSEYFKIEENALVTLKKFYNNKSSASYGGRMTYEVDNSPVKIAEYEKLLKNFTDDTEFDIGRKFSFTDAAENYALHFSESWGAVLTETEKEFYTSVLTELLNEGEADAAYELCDIDGDNIPELIYSAGNFAGAQCRVYHLDGLSISMSLDIASYNGWIGFDPENKVCFDGSAHPSELYSADGSKKDDITPSASVVLCGRKFPLREETLTEAFR